MNKHGNTIPSRIIGKLELINDMIEQVQDDDELDEQLKADLKTASNLIFSHANTDSEYFND